MAHEIRVKLHKNSAEQKVNVSAMCCLNAASLAEGFQGNRLIIDIVGCAARVVQDLLFRFDAMRFYIDRHSQLHYACNLASALLFNSKHSY